MTQNQVDRTAMTYIALRDLNVDGAVRAKGAAVPEAAGWKNVHNYISQGMLAVTQATQVGVPAGSKKVTKVGKPEGGAEYTKYRPVDAQTLLPSKIANDAS